MLGRYREVLYTNIGIARSVVDRQKGCMERSRVTVRIYLCSSVRAHPEDLRTLHSTAACQSAPLLSCLSKVPTTEGASNRFHQSLSPSHHFLIISSLPQPATNRPATLTTVSFPRHAIRRAAYTSSLERQTTFTFFSSHQHR